MTAKSSPLWGIQSLEWTRVRGSCPCCQRCLCILRACICGYQFSLDNPFRCTIVWLKRPLSIRSFRRIARVWTILFSTKSVRFVYSHTIRRLSFEHMTVALKTSKMRPHFMYCFRFTHLPVRGPKSRLSNQSRQNLICVNALKRGACRVPGASTSLNPNEKPPRANGFVIGSCCSGYALAFLIV